MILNEINENDDEEVLRSHKENFSNDEHTVYNADGRIYYRIPQQ